MKLSFKYEKEIKTFSDQRNLRQSGTSKPALQAILKEVLQDKKCLMESQTNRKQKANKQQQQNNTGNVQYGLESKTL